MIPDYGDPTDPEVRAKYGYFQSGICMGGNVVLFAGKLVIGLFIGSIAVFTDAFNQLSDVGVSLVILSAFYFAKKEADEEHPFGHGRLEHIIAVVVASLIIFAGIMLALESALQISNPQVQGNLLSVLILLAFTATKEGMAQLSFAVAGRIESNAIAADAWNHRFDAVVTGAIAFTLYLTTLGNQYAILDPFFGLGVAIMVLLTGVRLVSSSGERLMGRAPSSSTIDAIRSAAESVLGVRDAHEIDVHDYGVMKAVSTHIGVEEHLSTEEAHRIASQVEEKITSVMKAKPTVHIEPMRPLVAEEEIKRKVEEVLSRHALVHSFHKIELFRTGTEGHLDMHIRVDKNMRVRDSHSLSHEIQRSIGKRLPGYHLSIHVEPCPEGCELCNQQNAKDGE